MGQLRINQRISSAAVRRSNKSLGLLDPIRPESGDPSKTLGWRTDDLRDGAVTTSKVADAAIASSKILDGGVTTAKLADEAVPTRKVGDGAVTGPKIGDGAVTGPKIGPGAVGTSNLDPGTFGVALAGVKVSGGGTVYSWFNRFGGAPTIDASAAGVKIITFPGPEGRLGGNNVIHVATLRGQNVGFINATAVGTSGNVAVRTFGLAGNPSNRGANYVLFGTTTGPTP